MMLYFKGMLEGGKCNIMVNDDGIFKFMNDTLNNYDDGVLERKL